MVHVWRYTISLYMPCYVFKFPKWFYLFASYSLKNWCSYNMFFNNSYDICSYNISPSAVPKFPLSGWPDVDTIHFQIMFLILRFPSSGRFFFYSYMALHDGCQNESTFSCAIWQYFPHLVCTSSLTSHYSYWKFHETFLRVESPDLTVEGTSLQHL